LISIIEALKLTIFYFILNFYSHQMPYFWY